MDKQDVYQKLGKHLSNLGMAYPYKEDLIEILKENFSPAEAEVALLLPTGVSPMQPVGVEEILNKVDLPKDELINVLEGLAQRGLLFCGPTDDGHAGYALHQVGFGFPQTFFWKGEDTPHARNMARAMATYFLRETDKDACIGCGQCVEICPVDALNLEDDIAVVDQEWCIGCGVCATFCPADALKIVARSDKSCNLPAARVCELHDLILKEREQK